MNYSTYRFTLDLQKHQSVMSIAVFQYDSAVKLHISLTDGGKPYLIEVSKAVFYGKRSDGTAICKDCITTPGNAEIIYEFDNLTAEVLGTVNCQIRLYGIDGSLITAPRFTIVVEPRVIDADDVIESEAERDALDAIFATEAARITAEEDREKAEYARAEAETLRVEAELAREAAEEIRDRMRYGEWDHIITNEADLLNNLGTYEGNILVKGLDNVLGLSQKLNEGASLIKFVDTTLQNVSLEGNQNCSIEGLRIVTAGAYKSSIRNFGEVRDCNDIGGDPFDSLHIYNCNHIANCRFEHAEDCNYIDNCTVHTGSEEDSILLENCNYICGIVIEADGSWDFDPKGIFQNCSYLSNINVNASVNREKIELIYNGCTYVDAQTCSQFIDDGNVGKVQVLTKDGSFKAIDPAEEGGGGEDGEDGFSPTISVSEITGGHKLTITDINGEKSVDVMNGKDGISLSKAEINSDGNLVLTFSNGSAVNVGKVVGSDGKSPTVEVSKSGKVTTVRITDANGTKTATINDGADGTSVTVSSVSESTASGGSNVVTFSDGKKVSIKNGKDADPYILTATDKNEIAQNVKGVCVAKNQGAANVGKILVVGTDGNLTLADMPEGGGASGDVIGTLDDSNNILLSGNLADGTYTLKYENVDGTYTEIGTLTVGEAKIDNGLFEPDNAKLNYRMKSTGVEEQLNGVFYTQNYIPVTSANTWLYIKGCGISTTTAVPYSYSGIWYYDANKTLLGKVDAFVVASDRNNTEIVDATNKIYRLKIGVTVTNIALNYASSIAYARLVVPMVAPNTSTAITRDDVANVVIKIDEAIA